MEEVKISKLVHGGQGLAELSDDRKVFVWNALPGETVKVRVIKKKRSYAEAIAEDIVVASPERVAPREENYLATSPWQMMTFDAENKYKAEIVRELFQQAHIDISKFDLTTVSGRAAGAETALSAPRDMRNPLAGVSFEEWHYRNKMEYSFWGDDDGLHLALHRRGSAGKQIVSGSELALPAIDRAANAVLTELQKLDIRAGNLKTIVVRCSAAGEAVASLYTKTEQFPELNLPAEVKGLRVYYSNPKSPASVPTKLLQEQGNVTLQDSLLGKLFTYDVDSFFQVNLPVYELALSRIKEHLVDDPTDMYAGVGSIGLSVARHSVRLVEIDRATSAMARINAADSQLKAEVIEAPTEQATQYITCDEPVIFDPPRAGLHPKVVEACLSILPSQIIYMSCNPATHARDLALLQESYKIDFFEVYNFFPKTPHIETLAVLSLKH